MYTITLKPSSVLGLLLATRDHKPKGTTEFYDALQIAKALRPLYEERIAGDRVSLAPAMSPDESRAIVLESSAYRLLKAAFDAARDGGAVYSFGQAEMVCDAEEALKSATNGTPDPAK